MSMFLFLVSFPASALDEEEGSEATMVQEVVSLLHGVPLPLPCAYQSSTQQIFPQHRSLPWSHPSFSHFSSSVIRGEWPPMWRTGSEWQISNSYAKSKKPKNSGFFWLQVIDFYEMVEVELIIWYKRDY